MAFPRNSLSAFLGYAKPRLSDCLQSQRRVNIVVGNESADLDSLTSSLLYSYIRSTQPPAKAFSSIYVPLLNLQRSSIRLRPEFTLVCEQAGISVASLITLDDLPEGFLRLDSIRWLLVDHNRLTGQLEEVASEKVVGVIDHHEEEQFVRHTTDQEPRIIEKAGSCTSLVIQYCRTSWDAISSSSLGTGAAHGQGEGAVNDSAFTRIWDANIAKIALASILIDTANLNAPGKVESVDREAAEYLEARIMLSPKDAKTWDREAFFGAIQQAKSDIGGLTLEEILQKDYKQWTENGMKLGVSSVVKDLAFLVGKVESGSFSESLDNFMSQMGLAVFAIMTTSASEKGEFQRQLLLQVQPEASKHIQAFLSKAEGDLELKELQVEGFPSRSDSEIGGNWRNAWRQRNLSKSRKQVAPMLRAAMHQ